MNRRILIVGPSGSGKTSLAEALAVALGIPLISMDNFRAHGYSKVFTVEHKGRKIRNYEDPRMWDENAIACKLRWSVETGAGFIAEGNHLLMYPAIAALPGVERFYLDVPHAVSLARRRTRHRYLPADESFRLIGEAQTARHVAPQKHLPGVRVLDGTREPSVTLAEILGLVPVTP